MNTQNTSTHGIIPKDYVAAFILVTSLFFLWGIAHYLNDILIKQFQKALSVSREDASLVQTFFYLAYFIIPIPAGYVMKKYGFKVAILTGLLLYAVGALLFYPAAEIRDFSFFLGALFVIATGIIFLEMSGSAYITLTADPSVATRRINLSQSFNGLGSAITPFLAGIFIFSGIEYNTQELAALTPAALDAYQASEAKQVQMPYLAIAGLILLIATAVAFTAFPKRGKNHANDDYHTQRIDWKKLFSHQTFVWAIVAQLFYVGAQIGTWSYFIDFSQSQMPSLSEVSSTEYFSAGLVLFTIGRFAGTWMMNYISGRKLLGIYAVINIFLLFIAMTSSGLIAVIALVLTGFFMSIMFPTIYAIGIEELGDQAEIGSSFIMMTIASGALFPRIMGYLADNVSMQSAYIVPLVSFAVVAIFSLKAIAIQKNKEMS